MTRPEYAKTLGNLVVDWVAHHCVVPDGPHMGEPFEMVGWQREATGRHYQVRRDATVGQLAPAFRYRRSQVVGPQKSGKGPWLAAITAAEAVGPVLFAGWAGKGDVFRCRDHGCRCGWTWRYDEGEPMGRRWPTPLIQLTATSGDQVENVYGALVPMIQMGRLADVVTKVGTEFIRLPGGRVDKVTSNARSRLGQRVTFVGQDETGIWTRQTGMVQVAETQRRGLAGMGGRSIETTNPWDPAEQSVAQRTAEANMPDVFRYHRQAPAGWSFGDRRERRRILKAVYADCPWIDLDAIEAEAAELARTDPAQAERFFGNRLVRGVGSWMPDGLWESAVAAAEASSA